MLTAEEFAAEINVPYPTVALWLRKDRIKGATQLELGGLKIWQIPAELAIGFERPTRGRPSGVRDSKKRAKKKASAANSNESASAKPKPTKKARKKGSGQ